MNSSIIDKIIVDGKEDIVCSICYESIYKKKVYQCKLGHWNCEDCWIKCLKVKYECMQCRSKVYTINELSRNLFIEYSFANIQVYCPNSLKCENGGVKVDDVCKEIITVGQIDSHLLECKYSSGNNEVGLESIFSKLTLDKLSINKVGMVQCRFGCKMLIQNTKVGMLCHLKEIDHLTDVLDLVYEQSNKLVQNQFNILELENQNSKLKLHHVTWKTSFQDIINSRSTISDSFKIGEYSFHVRAFPNGILSNHLSIYLIYENEETISVRFDCSLLNNYSWRSTKKFNFIKEMKRYSNEGISLVPLPLVSDTENGWVNDENLLTFNMSIMIINSSTNLILIK